MTNPDFIYTTYINSTPEKVWQAITTPEFTRQYWGHELVSDWKAGAEWRMLRNSDHSMNVIGKVLESTPPNRLVLSWAEAEKLSDESQVVFEIETLEDFVRLSITHSKLSAYMAGRISQGWPRVLSSLKSLLETGKALSAKTGSCNSNAA
jgi:uncharacterized protein YndB with AHSA1/START domain